MLDVLSYLLFYGRPPHSNGIAYEHWGQGKIGLIKVPWKRRVQIQS